MLRPGNAGSFAKCRDGGRSGMIGRGEFNLATAGLREMGGLGNAGELIEQFTRLESRRAM
jgi:hypothetical protein